MSLTRSDLPPLGPFDFLDMHDVERRVVCESTGLQDVAVVDLAHLGRTVFIDGVLQSAEIDEHRYHEFLVLPAMMVHGNVSRVLVGGAGEGASLRELLRHDPEKIVAVDIDRRLVDIVREHLPTWHEGAFDDERVELAIESVCSTIARSEDAAFDLVILDLTDPGTGTRDHTLLTTSFFHSVKRVLGPRGLLMMQLGERHPDTWAETAAAADRLGRVFPWLEICALELESFGTTWCFALAGSCPRAYLPDDLERRLHPALAAQLREYDVESHRAFRLEHRLAA